MLRSSRPFLSAGLLAVLALFPTPMLGQSAPAPQRIGTVTAVQGQAALTRQSLPQLTALHFKDDVLSGDQLTTQEKSGVRLLLAGMGILTISEQSQIRLDETVASGGSRRVIVSLLQGELGVTLARGLMRPGEAVAIHTPTGVVETEQGVLMAQCLPAGAEACGGSTIAVVSGQATLMPQGQAPVTLGRMQAISLKATPLGIQTSAVQPLSSDQVVQLSQGLHPGKAHTAEPEGARMAQAQSQIAAGVAAAILEATTGQGAPTELPVPNPPTNTIAPVTPEVAVNVLPNGSLLSLNGYQLGLAAGTSLGTFSEGLANRVDPMYMSGPGTSVATETLLRVTGSPILHSGPIVTLENGASIAGAPSDTTTPLLKIEGADVTNVGGPIFGLRGNSAISTFGPLVSVDPSALTLDGPILSLTESSVTLGGPLLRVVDSEVTGTTIDSGLVRFINSDLSVTNASLLESQGSSLKFAGPLVSGGVVFYIPEEAPIPRVDPPFTGVRSSTPGKPLFHLIGGSLTLSGNGALLATDGGRIDIAGSLLAAEGARIDTSAATGSSIRLAATALNLTNGGSLISLGSGASMNAGATVFDIYLSKFVTIDGPVFALRDGSSLTLTGGPLVQMNQSQLTLGSLLTIGTASTVSLGGPLLNATDSSMTVAGSLVKISDSGRFASTTPEALVQLTRSPLTTGSGFLLTDGKLSLAGPLLVATDSPLAISTINTFFTFGIPSQTADTQSTGTDPFVQLTRSPLAVRGFGSLLVVGFVFREEFFLAGPRTMTLAGPLLLATDSYVFTGSNFVQLTGPEASLTSTGTGALIQLTRSPLTAWGSFFSLSNLPFYGNSGTAKLAGPLLVATDSLLTTRVVFLDLIGPTATLSSTTPDPLVQLTRSPLTTRAESRIGPVGSFLNVGSSSTVSLAGPLLVATDSPLTTVGGFMALFGPAASLRSTSPDALVQLTRSPLSLGLPVPNFLAISSSLGSAGTLALSGPLLVATDSPLTVPGSLVSISDGGRLTSTTTSPLISLIGGIHTIGSATGTSTGSLLNLRGANSDPVTGIGGPEPVLGMGGPVLEATGATINLVGSGNAIRVENADLSAAATGFPAALTGLPVEGGVLVTPTPLLSIRDRSTLTSTSTLPLIQFTNSSADINGSFFSLSSSQGQPPSTATLAGPLFAATNSSLVTRFTADLISVDPGATFKATTTQPLIQLSQSSLWAGFGSASGSFLVIDSTTGAPGTMTLAGPLLLATDSRITTGSSFLRLSGPEATLTSTTSNVLVQLSRSPLMAGGTSVSDGFVLIETSVGNAGSLNLAGPLLVATDSPLTIGGDFLHVLGHTATLTSTSAEALLTLTRSSLRAGVGLLGVFSTGPSATGSTLTLAGPLLVATDSPVRTGADFLNLVGSPATLVSAGTDPVVQLASSPLLAGGSFLVAVGFPNSTLSLAGPLLVATDSPLATSTFFLVLYSGGSSSLTSTGSAPLVELTRSPLMVGDTFLLTVGLRSALALAGPLLMASDSSIAAGRGFLDFGGESFTLTSTGPEPFVQLTRSPLAVNGSLVSVWSIGHGAISSTLSLAGPLLSAVDSPLELTASLLRISTGGQLASTTTNPLSTLSGGTHTIGSATGSDSGSLLDLKGLNKESATGLGTDQVLQTGGTVFEANGATVNLSGTGNAIRVDTALLAASAPIVNLINSTLNTSSMGNPITGAIHLFQSNVTSLGPVFGVDNSTLRVQSGPLLSLAGGSTMTVNGDFASLVNGSKITVLNGPLISVDGINSKGTASTLTISGGLINFGGTGGNQVIVNNSIVPTSTLSGLPVSVGGGGSSISIGPNPIKNTGLGTVSINGVLAGAGPHTGSLIQATNGGRVTIAAP